MIALDSDIYSLYLYGNESIMSKMEQRHHEIIALPIIVVEEVIRGRFKMIRQAQADTRREKLLSAYERLAFAVNTCAAFPLLAYSADADALCQQWKKQKIRVPTQDMRIGAICVSQGFRLATKNKRDFDLIPNLNLETWN